MAAIGFVVAKIVSPTENVFCLGKKEEYILHNKLEDGREKILDQQRFAKHDEYSIFRVKGLLYIHVYTIVMFHSCTSSNNFCSSYDTLSKVNLP